MIDKDAQIALLRKVVMGWMIEHGDRCRICSERSQNALKGVDNDWAHEAENSAQVGQSSDENQQ